MESVDLGDRQGLGRLPMPGAIASSLTMRRQVHRLVARARPEHLVTNTYKPVLLCHDLVTSLPTAIMLDATPRQFDRLGYFVDQTDRIPLAPELKYLIVRSLFRRAGALVAYSSWVAQSLVDDYRVPAERVLVIPPGVDTDGWAPVDKPRRRPRPEIIFVGADFERKGGSALLEWFRRCGRGRAQLTVVTRSPVAEEAGVRVVRVDNNSRDLRTLVRNADLFVLPTRSDAFSNAAIEAMASGLPVVIGGVEGIADIVEQGVTGYLVPPRDAAALEMALETLLASDTLRREMGAAARDRAVALFDSRRAFARIAAVGAAVAEGKSPKAAVGAGSTTPWQPS